MSRPPAAAVSPGRRVSGDRSRTLPDRGWRRTPAVVLAALLASCYGLSPELPEDPVDVDWPDGWPPPAVYVEEPLHPANRWFHRVKVLEEKAARLREGAPPASLAAPESGYSPVDRAEVMALLEVLSREGLPEGTPAERRSRFRADLREEAERLERSGEDGPLLDAYRDLLSRDR